MTEPRDLADRFQEAWLRANPFAASMLGVPGYDHLLPDDSAAGKEARKSSAEGFILQGRTIDAGALSPRDAVTLDCTLQAAEQEIAEIDLAADEYTVTAQHYVGPALLFSMLASSALTDSDAAQAYLTRVRGSGTWLDQATDSLREGAGRKRFPIGSLTELAIGWADGLLAAPETSPVLAPPAPDGWDGAAAFDEQRRAAVAEVINPALARWRDAVAQLLPSARPDDKAGLSWLPGGDADYELAIRVNTTLPLTARELHQTGLEHVAALEDRALALGAKLGLSSLAEIHAALRASSGQLSPEEAIRHAVAAVRRAEERIPAFFPAPYPAPCEVTPMPDVVALAGAAPHYTPPRLDGGRPGTFWFNTLRPTAGTGWDIDVVAFHEAVPGHHLQLSRVQLLSDLPALQRQGVLSVFAEGWGLYAESLAEETGLYEDERGLLGMISASLMRAVRLVVDTGLHAFGWSRQQAVEYAVAHVPMPPSFMASEIDRYLVIPGQALTYYTGKLEIERLRSVAQQRLGPAFSLPDFHAAVLDHGSLPMPTLARSIDSWLSRAAS